MTVLDLVRLVRKNLAVLLLCMLVGALAAAAWTLTRPAVYVASSTGLVVAGDTSSVTSATTGDMLAQQRAVAYTNLLGTRAVAERVQDTLSKRTPPVPAGGYTAAVMPGTAFINFTATAATAESAQATADAALNALVQEALRMETYGTVQTMDKPPEDLRRLTSIQILPYESATLPGAPQRPDLIRNVLLGLAAGLVLGIAIAIVRRQLDVKVRTQADVEELTGHSVVGVIPDSKTSKKKSAGRDLLTAGHAGEALRKLRTNLRFVNVDHPPRALVVTSANPGEGKSTIVANLARLVAMSGEDVVIVDCDLRRPVQATTFGVDAGVGVTQVLAGDLSAREALIPTGVPGLKVLPAGRIPPNPSELIGSRKMAELIRDLSRDAMVIIDAPPMLAVTDASLLTASADGALFVTVVGKTPKEQVRVCSRQLEMLGATLLGTVMNRVPKSGFGDVLYGYGYGSHYQSRSEKYYQKTADDLTPAVRPEAPSLVAVSADETPGRRWASPARVDEGAE